MNRFLTEQCWATASAASPFALRCRIAEVIKTNLFACKRPHEVPCPSISPRRIRACDDDRA